MGTDHGHVFERKRMEAELQKAKAASSGVK
jgi:hypothetical protein